MDRLAEPKEKGICSGLPSREPPDGIKVHPLQVQCGLTATTERVRTI